MAMSNQQKFFAVDLGATSGRTIVGTVSAGKIELQEITRFPNALISCNGHVYWDIYALYNEIIKGLCKVSEENIPITSIGIDTWGVDFVCVGKDGQLLSNPCSYRDPHTEGMMETYFKRVPRERVYELTGVQFINFNSLFQLQAMRHRQSSVLASAEKILFTPDALSYLLTGNMVTEYTIASTSQILNPYTKQLENELLEPLGLSQDNFAPIVFPGHRVGVLTEKIQQLTGLGALPVIAVAGHDTASAVAAVPACVDGFAYLSSGTWSLMGVEVRQPIINQQSFDGNFTNEGGVEGTTRFLKNICGMWLLEQCRKEWKGLGYDELIAEALKVTAFQSLINPDDASFANPISMIAAIRTYCQRTGQYVPETPGELARCIFDSLALRYREVFGMLRELAPAPIEILHVIGGGSRNALLNQFTSNALGIAVAAGPTEATAIGNIMLQAKAAGLVADIKEMRAMIASSVQLTHYQPQDAALWAEGFEKYLQINR